jgi:hypothetical protein
MSTVVFEQKIPGLAAVIIYDHCGHTKATGRYQIYKLRRLPTGKYRHSYVYRHQRPAAIEHAQKWLGGLAK